MSSFFTAITATSFCPVQSLWRCHVFPSQWGRGGGSNYCTEEKYIPSKGLPFGYVNLWVGINTIPPPEEKYFQKTVYFLVPVCVYTYLCPWLFLASLLALFVFFCFVLGSISISTLFYSLLCLRLCLSAIFPKVTRITFLPWRFHIFSLLRFSIGLT